MKKKILIAVGALFLCVGTALASVTTDVSNLDDLARAITSQSNSANMNRIRAYATAQAAATQSQEQAILDLQARVAALEGSDPPPPPPPSGDTTPPSPPANLRVSSTTQSKIVVAWSASSDDVGVVDYRVYRDGAVRGTTDNTLDWADFDLPCGTSYVYGVEAMDAAGNVSSRSFVTAATSPCDPPPPPPTSTGYPDASNTGVPDGTVLTAYTGPMTVTVDNTVIDSKIITGCMEIRASNVTIRNSKVQGCNGSQIYLSAGPGWDNFSLTITDSTIDCGKRLGSAGLSHGFMTVRRVEIVGCENGLSIDRDIDIQDSYIHDMLEGGGSHSDGIQLASHYDPPGTDNVVEGSLNVTIKHNTIMSMKEGAHTPEPDSSYYTTSAIITNDVISDTNILIENNLLAGGSYTLYCHDNGSANNVRIINNRFSTRYKSSVGYFGPTNHSCSDEAAWTGNVYDETGGPIPNG